MMEDQERCGQTAGWLVDSVVDVEHRRWSTRQGYLDIQHRSIRKKVVGWCGVTTIEEQRVQTKRKVDEEKGKRR
jgi:hypothetical protein